MAGQITVKAPFATLAGSGDMLKDKAITTDERLQSLSMGLAMIFAGDSGTRNPRLVRKDAEKCGKMIAGYAKIPDDLTDNFAADCLIGLGLGQESISSN